MINRTILVGRICSEPAVSKTSKGTSVLHITVANDQIYNGVKQTNFFHVTLWRNTAEFIATYATKGSLIGVEGQLSTNKFVNKQGIEVTETFVNGTSAQIFWSDLEKKKKDASVNTKPVPNDQSIAEPMNRIPFATSEPPLTETPFDLPKIDSDDLPF